LIEIKAVGRGGGGPEHNDALIEEMRYLALRLGLLRERG